MSHHENNGHDEHVGNNEHSFDNIDEKKHSEENYENEEEEEVKFEKMNDLQCVKYKDLNNVDIGKFFVLFEAKPIKKIFKINTNDILKKDLKKINLTKNLKIKILNLKRPINDIKRTKKIKDININHYIPETCKNTINLLNIENFYRNSGPYSDIIKPKNKFLSKYFKINLLKFKKNSLIFIINIFKKINYIKYLLIIFIIIFIFYGYFYFIEFKIQSSILKLKEIKFSTDIEKLKKDLVNIKSDLIISDFLLKPLFLYNYIFYNENLNNIKFALKGIENLINYGINLLIIYDGIHNLITQKGLENVMYSELIKNINPILFNLKTNINVSLDNLLKIKNITDKELLKLYNTKIDLIKNINNYTNIFIENIDILLSILADQKKKTYLIIFQNNDEIRPTGGFMGSVGFIEIYKGKIIKFEKKDIYALEWRIKNMFNEIAPEGLNKITNKFSLRDANYFPDIKESSEKIKSFLDKSEYKIDGIIYVNQNLILDFLKNFGGIYFEKVNKEITNENFSMIISTLVETKITKTHTLATPKQILFDFIDIYIKKLKKDGKYTLYIKTLLNSIEKKDIILHSFYDYENKFLEKLGLKKNINTSGYLDHNYPIFTSISGNKSDRYIERSFIKKIKKNIDCSYTTNLKILSKHNFDISKEINIKNFLYDMNLLGKVDLENTLIIQGKQINKQYVRLLLPENIIIKENDKIKISTINGKKQVSFYLNTPLLSKSEFNIEYKIPNIECKPYNFLFIKQPGIKEYKLNIINNGNLIIDNYFDKDFYILK